MHDQTHEYRTLKQTLVDVASLLNAILDVPINHPIPFVYRERAATLVRDIEALVREGKRNGNARSVA